MEKIKRYDLATVRRYDFTTVSWPGGNQGDAMIHHDNGNYVRYSDHKAIMDSHVPYLPGDHGLPWIDANEAWAAKDSSGWIMISKTKPRIDYEENDSWIGTEIMGHVERFYPTALANFHWQDSLFHWRHPRIGGEGWVKA